MDKLPKEIKKCSCKYTAEGKRFGECLRCFKMKQEAVAQALKKQREEIIKEITNEFDLTRKDEYIWTEALLEKLKSLSPEEGNDN